jgi:hypothetical protein
MITVTTAPFILEEINPPGPQVSSTNKTDRHDITEILLKVALNTIKQTNKNKQSKIKTNLMKMHSKQ